MSILQSLPFLLFETWLQDNYSLSDCRPWSWLGYTPEVPSTSIQRLSNAWAEEEALFSNGLSSVEEVGNMLQPPNVDDDISTCVAKHRKTMSGSLQAFLTSVLPTYMTKENILDASRSNREIQIFTSPLHRQILFSMANNFAGYGALPMSDVFRYLQVETEARLSQLIFLAPGYTSRAISWNLFRAAVELGDSRVVELLLENQSIDIDCNQVFYAEHHFTPNALKRAWYLGHLEVVRILLRHNAYFHSYRDWVGASKGGLARLDPRTFEMLLAAGGKLSLQGFKTLFDKNHTDLISVAIMKQAHENHIQWSKWGIFKSAVLVLDDQRAMQTIEILLNIGANLDVAALKCGPNEFVELNDEGEIVSLQTRLDAGPQTVLDAAVRRGSHAMVDILLKSGATMTGDTLTWAIVNEEETLIQFLLARGADIQAVGSRGDTPFERAIRLNNPSILQLLQANGAFLDFTNESQVTAALCAAAEAGNMTLIKHLIKLGGSAVPCLSSALSVAIEWGHDEAATLFIAAGADVNGRFTIVNPLTQALEQRNTTLVCSLLEADAVPRQNDLISAVEWGDHSMVEALILAGADANIDDSTTHSGSPLTAAVRRRDYDLIQLLLDTGAEMAAESDLTESTGMGGSALVVALRQEDAKMASYLLDRGAGLVDPPILGRLMVQDKHFLEAVLQMHEVRYPSRRNGFGSNALSFAVESGAIPLVKWMLEKGLDTTSFVFIPDVSHNLSRATPFGHAILHSQCNNLEIMELFLHKRCDPNRIVAEADYEWSSSRYTALLVAIVSQDINKIKLLLKYQASVNYPPKGGVKRTPLQKAAEVGNVEILELLMNHGADIHAPPAWSGGATALQLAAIGGYIPLVCKLLSHGADVNAPGAKVYGRTALEGAAEHGRLDMVQILLNAGAGSPSSDQKQVQNAKELANEKGWPYIADLIEDFFSSKTKQPEGYFDGNMLNDFQLDDRTRRVQS